MELMEIIEKRRAYKSLSLIEINEELIDDLAKAAQLAPSCFNNQPWRFVFVYGKENLEKFHPALSRGNAWAKKASMLIVVFSKPEFDCQLKRGDYFKFGVGLGTAFLLLRATELGLVAHPMAGYNDEIVKEALKIPEDMHLITVIAVGKWNENYKEVLEESQWKHEENRPKRKELKEFIYHNEFSS